MPTSHRRIRHREELPYETRLGYRAADSYRNRRAVPDAEPVARYRDRRISITLLAVHPDRLGRFAADRDPVLGNDLQASATQWHFRGRMGAGDFHLPDRLGGLDHASPELVVSQQPITWPGNRH